MKKADFDSAEASFRAALAAEAVKPQGEQAFPEEWLRVSCRVSCHTKGCANEGLSWNVQVGVNSDGEYRVRCAKCGERIRDVVGVFDDTEAPMFTGEAQWTP